MLSEDPVKEEIKRRLTMFELARTGARQEYTECPYPDCPGRIKNKEKCQLYKDGTGFKCYICKRTGDVFSWEMLTQNITYAEARRNLARYLGIALAPNRERIELLSKVVKRAHQWLFDEHPERLDYLLGRGLSKSILWQFGVGYIDPDHEVLTTCGVTRQQLIHLGLVYPAERLGERDYSAMQGRFIFPLRDTRGRIVQLKGRADPTVLTAEQIGKKKSLPLRAEPFGSPWGRCSNQDYLFGEEYLGLAKQAGYAILNEGEPDTLTMRTLEFHAFGLQGSEGLAKHAHKLQGTGRIYVMLDNDPATQFTIIKELFDLQVRCPDDVVYNVTIPALLGTDEEENVIKVDANDTVSKFGWTKQDHVQLLREAPEARDLIVEAWGPYYKDVQKRNDLSRLMIATKDRKKKDAMISRLAEITGKSVDALTFGLDPEYHDQLTA